MHQKFGVVWFIAVFIQAAGVIFIIASSFLFFLIKPFNLAPDPDLLWDMPVSAYQAMVDVANVTTFTAITGYILTIVIGLLAVTAGQALIVLMAIEKNLRLRRQPQPSITR